MKAVVLSGGQGTRLKPLTYSVPKQLIPIGGRPVLARVLDDIVSCGISAIAVVTSPEAADSIGAMLSADSRLPVEPQVLIQPEPNGLAAAFGVALPFVGGEPSLLYLGDCLVTGGVQHVIDEARSTGADATLLVAEVDDPSRYGVVELGAGGSIVNLAEKPAQPPSNLAIVGVYVFAAGVEDVINSVKPSWRGEYEITDALQLIVDRGGLVRPSRLKGSWIDTGTVEDVLRAQTLLLRGLEADVSGTVESSTLSGSVRVEPGAIVRGSVIDGPAIVEGGAIIEDSHVGPATTIGPRSRVVESTVSGSILMEDVVVQSAGLDRSILGPRATVRGSDRHSSLSVIVGADASVTASVASHSG